MNTYEIIPEVDSTQEFIEIAYDFSNPLDLVREAISNSFDANATEIILNFSVISEYGEKILKISIEDNGDGMNELGLKSFFDLGNSLRRNDENTIGEKGHGTKVYFNSRKIEVVTYSNGKQYQATMNEPSRKLFDRQLPRVSVNVSDCQSQKGTKIIITGYNNNNREKFVHCILKDFILWFTKFGSIERCFDLHQYSDVVLKLKGIDKKEFETINFGHIFPKESKKVADLFDEHLIDAPKHYCKKIVRKGNLPGMGEIEYNAVFYIEGNKVKYSYNDMVRRSGHIAPEGSYTIQERYGLWLCKDFIPIQRKNEWITKKGYEYTKFHAFINCQDLRLTANRGSIENTPLVILQALKGIVEKLYTEITESSDWQDMEWLESETNAYNTAEKEKKDFDWRIDKINRAKIADYHNIRLIEPQRESGVFTIYMQLSSIEPDLFPFKIIDYDTHSGIDVIVKAKDTIPIKSSKLYYVEFKNYLEKRFNHSFGNLHSIICWDINLKDLKNGDEVTDIANQNRTLKIIPPAGSGDYTRYYLDSVRMNRKIEIFVLKYYFKEKLNIDFHPRTENESY